MFNKPFYLVQIILLITVSSCVSLPQAEFDKAIEYKTKTVLYHTKTYAPEEYSKAEQAFTGASNYFNNTKNRKAKKGLVQANELFVSAIEKGLPLYADDLETTSLSNIERAKKIKAEVAVKSEFEKANDLLNEARNAEKHKHFEKAIGLYRQAIEKFQSATTLAEEKKVRAEAAIDGTETQLQKANKAMLELEKLKSETGDSK